MQYAVMRAMLDTVAITPSVTDERKGAPMIVHPMTVAASSSAESGNAAAKAKRAQCKSQGKT